MDKFAIMPFNAPGRRLICPINILDALIVQTSDPTLMQAAMGQTEAIMRSRRQLKPEQESNFAFQTAEGALGSWKKISKVLIVALPGLVAISLVVGGPVRSASAKRWERGAAISLHNSWWNPPRSRQWERCSVSDSASRWPSW
jgi:hypothetical protein